MIQIFLMIVTTLLENIFVYVCKVDCFDQTVELFGIFDAHSVVDLFFAF